MISRRTFIKRAALAAAGSSFISRIGESFLNETDTRADLTILYTNDTHSRLDPFPNNARKYAGLGGIARRASLVDKIRHESSNVLLLDAGDVFQGTPWFEVYGGELSFKIMSEMGYDAMAIGNHEFDLGLKGLAEAARHTSFPMLAANYHTRNTAIDPFVKKYIVRDFSGFRIGIFGLGIKLKGVVEPQLHGDVQYRNPVIHSRRIVESLRNFHHCDYIVCLSHLGYSYGQEDRIDDLALAQEVPGLDLIIGGHTHTFLDEPDIVWHSDHNKTRITQMGYGGVRLGRVDLNLSDLTDEITEKYSYYVIGEEQESSRAPV